jgi:hypothetical protein
MLEQGTHSKWELIEIKRCRQAQFGTARHPESMLSSPYVRRFNSVAALVLSTSETGYDVATN